VKYPQFCRRRRRSSSSSSSGSIRRPPIELYKAEDKSPQAPRNQNWLRKTSMLIGRQLSL